MITIRISSKVTFVAAVLSTLILSLHSCKQHDRLVFELDSIRMTRISLSGSTWPGDNGDGRRGKFGFNAGFTEFSDLNNLRIDIQKNAPRTQWLYTFGKISDILFTIGSAPKTNSTLLIPHLTKLNSTTLDILQTFQLNPSLYLGGILAHKNGNVYCVHANALYTFYGGDLTNFSETRIPTSLNSNVVQANGLLVTSDGFLVVKQWNFNLEDAFFVKAGVSIKSMGIFCVILIVSLILCVGSGRLFSYIGNTFEFEPFFHLVVLGLVVGLSLIAFLIIMSVKSITGPFNYFTFVSSNLLVLNGGGGGEVKILDPVSLHVVAAARLPERASFSRLAIVPTFNAVTGEYEEDAIVATGDEHIFQLRWRPSNSSLRVVDSWTRRYRQRGDGTFPGTDPVIHNGTVYFTDNRYAGFLYGRSYSLFALPLSPTATVPAIESSSIDAVSAISTCASSSTAASSESSTQCQEIHGAVAGEGVAVADDGAAVAKEGATYIKSVSESSTTPKSRGPPPRNRQVSSTKKEPIYPRVNGVHLTQSSPGFNFFSVAISPIVGDVVVWDTAGRKLQSRSMHNLSHVRWEANITNTDSVAIAADTGHIYVTDYGSQAPPTANSWVREMFGSSESQKSFAAVTKFFVVLDVSTGAVLANVSLSEGEPLHFTAIAPGANNDVFIGTVGGVARVHIPVKDRGDASDGDRPARIGSSSCLSAGDGDESTVTADPPNELQCIENVRGIENS